MGNCWVKPLNISHSNKPLLFFCKACYFQTFLYTSCKRLLYKDMKSRFEQLFGYRIMGCCRSADMSHFQPLLREHFIYWSMKWHMLLSPGFLSPCYINVPDACKSS